MRYRGAQAYVSTKQLQEKTKAWVSGQVAPPIYTLRPCDFGIVGCSKCVRVAHPCCQIELAWRPARTENAETKGTVSLGALEQRASRMCSQPRALLFPPLLAPPILCGIGKENDIASE